MSTASTPTVRDLAVAGYRNADGWVDVRVIPADQLDGSELHVERVQADWPEAEDDRRLDREWHETLLESGSILHAEAKAARRAGAAAPAPATPPTPPPSRPTAPAPPAPAPARSSTMSTAPESRRWGLEAASDAEAVAAAYAAGLGRERPELASAAQNVARLAGGMDRPEQALAFVLERGASHEPVPPTLETIARRLGVADPAALAAKAGHAEGGSPVDVARAVVNALQETARERAAVQRRRDDADKVFSVLYSLPAGVLSPAVERRALAEKLSHLALLGGQNGMAGIAEMVTGYLYTTPGLVEPDAPDGWPRLTIERFRPQPAQPQQQAATSSAAASGRL